MTPPAYRPPHTPAVRTGLGAPPLPPPALVRVDPADGAAGVFRDAPVIVRFSSPILKSSLSPETLQVKDADGDVPGRIGLSPEGLLVIWTSERLLVPGVTHFVVVTSGLTDVKGRAVAPHVSRFVPCDLVREDVSG